MAEIILPYRLSDQINHHAPVTVSAPTVKAALQQLLQHYPSLGSSIWADASEAALTGYTQLFVNQQQVTDLNAPLQMADRLQIVQAMAGG